MELIQYTTDESNRYIAATAILGEVVARCSKLFYNSDSEEEKAAIREFEWPYAIWRNTLEIADRDGVERVYTEVKPLIDDDKITLDYIFEHTRYVPAVV